MTIASETSKSGPYTGDGANTTFAYGFKIYDEAEIQVIHTVIATGVETVLVLNTDYTVASVGSATGTITYPISGSPLPSTEKLTIVRDMTFTQLVDLQNQGGYYPETVERVFDRTEQKLQQLKEVTDRCVKVDVSSSTSPDALLDDVNAAAAAAAASATASASSATTSTAAATAAGTAQTAAEAAQVATEAVYDAFDDRYLGSKTSDPALDNDGNALVVGAMYFNSVTGVLRVYASGGWTNAGQSSVTTYTYIATSSQTAFTGADDNGNTLSFESSGILGVFLNGVSLREGASYDWTSSSGTTVTLTSGATTGDVVEIKVVAAFAVADAISQTTADARYVKIADGLVGAYTPTKGNILAGDGTAFNEVTVGTNGKSLVADSTQTEGVKWDAPVTVGGSPGKEYVFVSTPENYTTSAQQFTAAAHGLPGVPQFIEAFAVCIVADLGYSVGDVINLSPTGSDGTNSYGIQIWADATYVDGRCGTSGLTALNKSTGAITVLTKTPCWQIYIVAKYYA